MAFLPTWFAEGYVDQEAGGLDAAESSPVAVTSTADEERCRETAANASSPPHLKTLDDGACDIRP